MGDIISVIVVSLFLLTFSLSMFSFAVCIVAYLSYLLVQDIVTLNWRRIPGTVLTCAVMVPFSYMFGGGAYALGVDILDGMLGLLA